MKLRKEDYTKDYLKDSNLYLVIAFVIIVILFSSPSQTYEQQSQAGLLDKLLSSHPFEEQLKNISFQYAGSEVSIQASGYSKFAEFFVCKGAHFGTYSLLGGSWFTGSVPRIKGLFLTAIASWLVATGYVGLDEFHQMITGGRALLFQDVTSDVIGALTTIVICLVVRDLKKNKKRRR